MLIAVFVNPSTIFGCGKIDVYNGVHRDEELYRVIQSSLDSNKDVKPVSYHTNVNKLTRVYML